MARKFSIRYAAIAALGAFAILWGNVEAVAPSDAAEVLEVQVLEAPIPGDQGERYRMQVLSVLRSASGLEPGEIVTVRTPGASGGDLGRGWMGTAYLNPDPSAAGTGRHFVGSLVKLPPGPPSATFTRYPPRGDQ